MRFGWSPKEAHVRVRNLSKVATFLFIAGYIVIYLVQPFSDFCNTLISDLFYPAAALFPALVATLIWTHYEATDAPLRVWRPFAIGLWLWVVAELTWAYLNMTQGEVPIGLADVFWASAYLFFGGALVHQYYILVKPTTRELLFRTLIGILGLLVVNLLIYIFLISTAEESSKFDAAVNAFYPAADLVLSLIALWHVRHFMGGAFSRPWMGLFAFTIADFMYAWADISGLYPASLEQGNWFSTITDITYFAAYLILGLGILSHWVFLRYGLRSPAETK